MEQVIYTALANSAAIGALVGGTGANARVYPLLMPQGSSLPAVTYFRVSTDRIATASLSGHNARVNARVQIDCWADTYANSKSLASAVKSVMLSATTFTALSVSERDLYEPDTEVYRVSADFSVWYLEA